MKYRPLGRTGFEISEVSFGAWAIGGTWGQVDDNESMKALKRALDLGVNFFDTADVYGDGRSEQLIARLRSETKVPFFVTTKAGRRVEKHTADGYTKPKLAAFIERRTSASRRSISCSSTARPPTSTTGPRCSAHSTSS
jgi:aryl-alcohol dehydrogenase-like predicted oxidoreductase